jgi:hypothetical protein
MPTTEAVQMQKAVGKTMPTQVQSKNGHTSYRTTTRHNQNSNRRQIEKLNAHNASKLKKFLSQQQGQELENILDLHFGFNADPVKMA